MTVDPRTLTRADHIEHLEAMIENADQAWDFSDRDYAALNWALARITRLESEIMRLNSLRPAGTPLLSTAAREDAG